MFRSCVAAFGLFVFAALLAGCTSQTAAVPDTDTRDENVRLKNQVGALETDKTNLQKELIDKEGEISASRMESEQWKAKYQAAKDSVPAGGDMVPPDVMAAFVDMARSGGPWEVTSAGSLKTSSDVFFDSGKTELKTSGQSALKEIAPKLKQLLADKRVTLAVEGHTDDQPILHSGFKDNRHLSLMRAHAVVTFLVEQGVPAAAMSAVGYGEFRPIADNKTTAGRSHNRRVELRLVNAGAPTPAPAPTLGPAVVPPPTPPAEKVPIGS